MSNSARLYNVALARDSCRPPDFPFEFTLSGDHVWSAIMQLSLIEDLSSYGQTLAVPHHGEHKDRFTVAIEERNLRIRMFGQEELTHYCSKCTVVEGDPSVPTGKFSVVVTDGVTVGHPCCSVHNCHQPLVNYRDRFCLQHLWRTNICSIVGCERHAVPSSKACDLPSHQAVEQAHILRGQAFFQLQKRLQRSRVANPVDSLPAETELPPSDDEDDLELLEEEDTGEGKASDSREGTGGIVNRKSSSSAKPRAQFSRRRTHNEQLIVAPCGIILARETFFGAEGVASVIVSVSILVAMEESANTTTGDDQTYIPQ